MVESLERRQRRRRAERVPRRGVDSSAIEVVAEAKRRLSSNVDETLLLNDLMLSLMEF